MTMTKEDAKDLALSVLIVAAVALAADDACLHWRIGRVRRDAEQRIEALEAAADEARAVAERPRPGWRERLRFWEKKQPEAGE